MPVRLLNKVSRAGRLVPILQDAPTAFGGTFVPVTPINGVLNPQLGYTVSLFTGTSQVGLVPNYGNVATTLQDSIQFLRGTVVAPGAPLAPSSVVFSSIQSVYVALLNQTFIYTTLVWQPNNPAGLVNYKVYTSPDNVTFTLKATITGSPPAATYPDTTSTTQLYYAVTATNGTLESQRSPAIIGAAGYVTLTLDGTTVIGYAPADDPEGIFYGTTVNNGDTWWPTTVPPGVTVIPGAGGSFVIAALSTVAAGNYSFSWSRRTTAGVITTGTKAFAVANPVVSVTYLASQRVGTPNAIVTPEWIAFGVPIRCDARYETLTTEFATANAFVPVVITAAVVRRDQLNE